MRALSATTPIQASGIDYAAWARTLLDLQAKCGEWGQALRRKGWIDADTNTHGRAAQTPEAKAAELTVMGLVKAHEAILTYCRTSFVPDPSTPLDRAFDYIGIYLGRGADALRFNTVALPECLAVEVAQPSLAEQYREPTFIVQLGRWATHLMELAASAGRPVQASGGKATGQQDAKPAQDEPRHSRGKLFWPFAIVAVAVLFGFEGALVYGAWLWGEGSNLWQKVHGSWLYLGLAFGIWGVVCVCLLGERGRRLLRLLKGDSD